MEGPDGKLKQLYLDDLMNLGPLPVVREWDDLRVIVADRRQAERLVAFAEDLGRNVEALLRQHDAEKAQLHAEREVEKARLKADLARSEREKADLQAELDDTRYENGELSLENAALRHQLMWRAHQRPN